VAQTVLARASRIQRALSPWVQRWLKADYKAGSRWRAPFARRQPAFSMASTRWFLARAEDKRERSTTWRPDVGSLSPDLVDRFAGSITDRFEPFGARYQPQPPADQEPLELPLAHETGGLVSGGSEPAPVTPSLPPFTRRQPDQRSATRHPDRSLPPKARLFSRVEEVTSEPPPAREGAGGVKGESRPLPVEEPASGQPASEEDAHQSRRQLDRPEMPRRMSLPPSAEAPDEPHLSATAAVKAATSDRPVSPEGASEQPGELLMQRQPAPDQPTTGLKERILARATSRRQMPLTQPLPLLRSRPSVTKTVQPQVARAWLSTRGWRFKTKAQDASAAPGRVTRAVDDLEQGVGPGQPLSSKPRLMMERVMDQDLSDVRVHTAQLAPLGVQAATRGRDIYVEPGQDRFDTPQSLGLLGHELTHVSRGGIAQTKPLAQTAILPQARVQREVEDEEAVADSNEQTLTGLFQSSSTSTGSAPAGSVFRQPAMPDFESEETMPTHESLQTEDDTDLLSPGTLADSPELFQRQQASLQIAALEMTRGSVYEELAHDQVSIAPEDLDTMAADEVPSEEEVTAIVTTAEEEAGEAEEAEEAAPTLDLDELARQVYPFIKQRLAVERERRAAI